jgi:putative alpha-1,2-mannosidase
MIKKVILPCLLLSAMMASAQQNLVQYVKPIIGTSKMGHTYPGATVPFGSVQLSPETDTLSYEVNGKYNGEYISTVQVINTKIKPLPVLVIPISVVQAIQIWAIS